LKINTIFSWFGWPLFVGIIAIGIGVWRTSLGLESNMDIRFYDESYYLTQGLFQPIESWLADYSAFYSLYYKGLSLFESDAIQLYYLNYRIWAFVFAGSVFILLWRFGVHPFVGLLWAICALCAQINFLLWPKAGHFAMLGVSIALMGATSLKESKSALLIWISGICACIAWARPEFSLGALAGLLILVFQLIHVRRLRFNFPFWVGIPWILATSFFFLWGFPIGKSGRGNVAFGQHFVHNLGKLQGKSEDQMLSDWVNWRFVFNRQVGNPDEMASGFLAKPGPLFEHLFLNGKNLVSNLFTYFSETLVPVHWIGLPVFFTLGVAWLIAEGFNGFNGMTRFWHRNFPCFRSYGLLIFPLALPSLTAGFLFQPRPHYILPLFPLFLVVMALWLREIRFPHLNSLIRLAIPACICLVALVALPDSGAFFKIEKEGIAKKNDPNDARYFSILTKSGLKNIGRIQALSKASLPKGCRIFDGSTGVSDFLGNSVIQKGKTGFEMNYKSLENFESFVQTEQVNAIYLAPSLQKDHFFNQIAWLERLKTNPESLGWIRLDLENSEDQLFLKSKL
jgi:hypothetical protein